MLSEQVDADEKVYCDTCTWYTYVPSAIGGSPYRCQHPDNAFDDGSKYVISPHVPNGRMLNMHRMGFCGIINRNGDCKQYKKQEFYNVK